jgi:hypothetical protein
MDIDTNTRNGTSTVTPGDSSEHEDDTTPNEPIPIDTDMPSYSGLSPMLDESILIDTDMPDHTELSPTPDEPIPIDTDTPDHPGHSPTPEVQSTTHRRLTIASLCNPSNEDLYVRPHRADTLFDKTLEPVRVPSRIRGCSSESLYIYIFL